MNRFFFLVREESITKHQSPFEAVQGKDRHGRRPSVYDEIGMILTFHINCFLMANVLIIHDMAK